MESAMLDEVSTLCSHLESLGGGGGAPVDVRGEFNLAVLNSLWRILAGDRLGYQDARLRRMVELLDRTLVSVGGIVCPTYGTS